MSFPCIKCGLCCRHVDVAVETSGLEFPYKWDETGRCEMLGENDLCKVYESRPLLCNIDRFIQEYGLDEKETYNANISCCNEFLKEDNRTERIDFIL